jgi:hypothetical protein
MGSPHGEDEAAAIAACERQLADLNGERARLEAALREPVPEPRWASPALEWILVFGLPFAAFFASCEVGLALGP